MDIDRRKLILVTIGTFVLQSNSINTDTEGAIESLHINGVSLQPLQRALAARPE